jgi:hypothetical protein
LAGRALGMTYLLSLRPATAALGQERRRMFSVTLEAG